MNWSYVETIANFTTFTGGPNGDSPVTTEVHLLRAEEEGRTWWRWQTEDGLSAGEAEPEEIAGAIAAAFRRGRRRDWPETFLRFEKAAWTHAVSQDAFEGDFEAWLGMRPEERQDHELSAMGLS